MLCMSLPSSTNEIASHWSQVIRIRYKEYQIKSFFYMFSYFLKAYLVTLSRMRWIGWRNGAYNKCPISWQLRGKYSAANSGIFGSCAQTSVAHAAVELEKPFKLIEREGWGFPGKILIANQSSRRKPAACNMRRCVECAIQFFLNPKPEIVNSYATLYRQ